ncbi:MAG: hypothetical protein ACXVB2_24635 [Isosphaeraceae bacterium]
MIRYQFEFIGSGLLPPAGNTDRYTPVVPGTVELYRTEPFLVESVDHEADPPMAVLRKVRS